MDLHSQSGSLEMMKAARTTCRERCVEIRSSHTPQVRPCPSLVFVNPFSACCIALRRVYLNLRHGHGSNGVSMQLSTHCTAQQPYCLRLAGAIVSYSTCVADCLSGIVKVYGVASFLCDDGTRGDKTDCLESGSFIWLGIVDWCISGRLGCHPYSPRVWWQTCFEQRPACVHRLNSDGTVASTPYRSLRVH